MQIPHQQKTVTPASMIIEHLWHFMSKWISKKKRSLGCRKIRYYHLCVFYEHVLSVLTVNSPYLYICCLNICWIPPTLTFGFADKLKASRRVSWSSSLFGCYFRRKIRIGNYLAGLHQPAVRIQKIYVPLKFDAPVGLPLKLNFGEIISHWFISQPVNYYWPLITHLSRAFFPTLLAWTMPRNWRGKWNGKLSPPLPPRNSMHFFFACSQSLRIPHSSRHLFTAGHGQIAVIYSWPW